ncbi:MAG: ABC-type transporter, integral rane subunit [Gemmatimonadetes bacterium]|nr:ABC-type transporter, integral rane subunit [Gemmatimonadota bacterium]
MSALLSRMSRRHAREAPPTAALGIVLIAMGVVAPSFFSAGNLRDLALNNVAVMIVALGMTLVVLTGEIDISVGSQFAVCSVAAGMLAKAGVPIMLVPVFVLALGVLMGALNGLLIGMLGLPSIIVTLAMMVAWRDTLRWTTDGAWIQDLPANFQWFGMSPEAAQLMIMAVGVALATSGAWALRHLALGRRVYAVGADAEAARLAGIDPRMVKFGVFATTGMLVSIGAMLNAVRFSTVPSNAGIGFELQAVAAVVVGGTAITGGRGTILGTVIGVALLGAIGTALTYVGIGPFWVKAIQGLIILAALGGDALFTRLARRAHLPARAVVAH